MGQFNELAAAFQCQLADLPARLHDTIPNFHHTRSRFDTLMQATIDFFLGRQGEATFTE